MVLVTCASVCLRLDGNAGYVLNRLIYRSKMSREAVLCHGEDVLSAIPWTKPAGVKNTTAGPVIPNKQRQTFLICNTFHLK